MNNQIKRDEFNYRLSSFLYEKGKLESQKISMIKAHVFFLEAVNGDELIVKKHRNKENVDQQWHFFDAVDESQIVPFINFPNGQKVISSNHSSWTISPYIQGDKLYYKRSDDRKEAIRTLQKFHNSASNISVAKPIIKDSMFIRWYRRLLNFKKTEMIFKEHGFMNLYKDIVQMTIAHFRFAAKFPWESKEKSAIESGLWIHGDVASHNFLRNDNTYLIDFDLLQCTAQIYDYIQLGQRFLPYLNWDLERFLSYRIVKESELKPLLYAIFIPSDLLREWLYFISSGKKSSVYNYLYDMEKEWLKRLTFLKHAKSMLKSL